jgi:hypothetical protein
VRLAGGEEAQHRPESTSGPQPRPLPATRRVRRRWHQLELERSADGNRTDGKPLRRAGPCPVALGRQIDLIVR